MEQQAERGMVGLCSLLLHEGAAAPVQLPALGCADNQLALVPNYPRAAPKGQGDKAK